MSTQCDTDLKLEYPTSSGHLLLSPELHRTLRYNDVMYPSVELITEPITFCGERLDRSKGNYKQWRRSVQEALGVCGLIYYTLSDAVPPDATLEPRANANWHANDERACWFITSTCSHIEQDFIEPPGRGAAEYWKKIEERHMPDEQVDLLKRALSLRVTDDETQDATLTKAYSMADRAWSMGPITLKTFKSVLAFYILENSGKTHRKYRGRCK